VTAHHPLPLPPTPHPALARLDALAEALSHRDDVVAVLGLGSAGVEQHRFDDHSDLDVFVVVDDGSVTRYVDDVGWLAAAGEVAWSFRNERDGRKVLYADGLFVEYAVLTLDRLAGLPFTGARTVHRREDAPSDLATCGPPPPRQPFDTIEFHVGEAVTNLYVGLHRELRGERLAASRFIQGHAVDRVVSLLRLTEPGAHAGDPFDRSRRVEQAWPPHVLPLADMVPGYARNAAAATAVLAWLTGRFDVDPAVVTAVEGLLTRCRAED
jgi:hypothetical protein